MDYDYEVLDNGTIIITKYNGKEKDIIIPEKIDGKIVSVIDTEAFEGHSEINSVVIPKTIQEIYQFAFGGCRNLKKVYISNGLTFMDDFVFDACDHMEEITFEEGTNVSINYLTVDENLKGCTIKAGDNCSKSIYEQCLLAATINENQELINEYKNRLGK